MHITTRDMIAVMEQIERAIADLQEKGWTIAAIADAVDVRWYTVQRWAKGVMRPANPTLTLAALQGLAKRNRVPARRRVAQDSQA